MNGYARPKSFKATQSGSDINLSWEAEVYNTKTNTDGSWYIYRSDTQLGSVPYSTTSFTDTGFTCSKYNYYKVVFVPTGWTAKSDISGLYTSTSKSANHTYGEATWKWTGHESATCSRTCTNTSCTTSTTGHAVSATVTLNGGGIKGEELIAAECTETGTTRYTATATVLGEEYSNYKDVADIPALGHGSEGYTDTYTWKGDCFNDETQDTKACEFTLTCKKCSSKVVDAQLLDCTKTAHTDATCTGQGSTTYEVTGSYTADNAEYNYSDTKSNPYPIPAFGHTIPQRFDEDGFKTCSVCHADVAFEPVGPQNGWYLIENAGQLYDFAEQVNKGVAETYKVRLNCDIIVNRGSFDADGNFTAEGATEKSTPRRWTPIRSFPEGSVFDGEECRIEGLYCNDAAASGSVGFIAESYGTIQLLNMANCYIVGNEVVGAICGTNEGTISRCSADGTVIAVGMEKGYVGGITGANHSTVKDCHSTCEVSGYGISGGICGMNEKDVSNCYSRADVTGGDRGSICGWSTWSISNCYSSGSLEITGYGEATSCETGVTKERFASGEIAYRLNGSIVNDAWKAGPTDNSQAWYQRLPSTTSESETGDVYPHLKRDRDGLNTVYCGYDCKGSELTYANRRLWDDANQDHLDGDANGICDLCGTLVRVKVELAAKLNGQTIGFESPYFEKENFFLMMKDGDEPEWGFKYTGSALRFPVGKTLYISGLKVPFPYRFAGWEKPTGDLTYDFNLNELISDQIYNDAAETYTFTVNITEYPTVTPGNVPMTIDVMSAESSEYYQFTPEETGMYTFYGTNPDIRVKIKTVGEDDYLVPEYQTTDGKYSITYYLAKNCLYKVEFGNISNTEVKGYQMNVEKFEDLATDIHLSSDDTWSTTGVRLAKGEVKLYRFVAQEKGRLMISGSAQQCYGVFYDSDFTPITIGNGEDGYFEMNTRVASGQTYYLLLDNIFENPVIGLDVNFVLDAANCNIVQATCMIGDLEVVSDEDIAHAMIEGGSFDYREDVAYGTQVLFRALSIEGVTFEGWYADINGDPVSTESDYEVSVSDDVYLTAVYSVNEGYCAVSAKPADDGGFAFVNGKSLIVVPDDEVFDLYACPENGYKFVGWTKIPCPEDGEIVYDFIDPYVPHNVNDDTKWYAVFEETGKYRPELWKVNVADEEFYVDNYDLGPEKGYAEGLFKGEFYCDVLPSMTEAPLTVDDLRYYDEDCTCKIVYDPQPDGSRVDVEITLTNSDNMTSQYLLAFICQKQEPDPSGPEEITLDYGSWSTIFALGERESRVYQFVAPYNGKLTIMNESFVPSYCSVTDDERTITPISTVDNETQHTSVFEVTGGKAYYLSIDAEAEVRDVMLQVSFQYVLSDEDENMPALLEQLDGQLVIVDYTRQMSNKWGTLVLPFGFTYQPSNPNYKLYKLTAASVDGEQGTLTFTEYKVDNSSSGFIGYVPDWVDIPAGTPVLVMATGEKNSDNKYTISISRQCMVDKTAGTTAAFNGICMKGTYEAKEITDKDGCIFGNGAFWKTSSLKTDDDQHVYCPPFHAYLAGEMAGAKRITLKIPTDQNFTTSDVQAVADILLGKSTVTDVSRYDVDGNAGITIADQTYIIQIAKDGAVTVAPGSAPKASEGAVSGE